jgi:integrase
LLYKVLTEQIVGERNRAKTFSIYDIYEEPSAKDFLESISRNGRGSKKAYASGLLSFHDFLDSKKYTLASIIEPLKNNQIDVYSLLNQFVSYLLLKKGEHTYSPSTIKLQVSAIRSYLQFYDIDIVAAKFKRKCKMPKLQREDEEALDAADIRNILLSCNNRRVKAYLLVLASGGFRAVEAAAIRVCDINFDASPTKIHVRKEYAKTKTARDVYISDEATKFVKEWMNWKYREKPSKYGEQRIRDDNDLVFSMYRTVYPIAVYEKLRFEFVKILDVVGLGKRKELGEHGIQRRREITPHSFRRYVKTVISDQVSKEYSEWFLGHAKSPYYTKKEPERREMYAGKCMNYLTFLDYTTLEATGKNIETKLSEKEKEIQLLRQRDSINTDAIANLSDQVMKLMIEVQEIKSKK